MSSFKKWESPTVLFKKSQKFEEIVDKTQEARIKNQTFYLNNDTGECTQDKRSCADVPVRACGILFYKKTEENKYEFLMIHNFVRKCYEDFGGKIDRKIDSTIYETAAREAEEESNGIFKKLEIINSLYTCPFIYHEMYLLFIVEIDKSFYNMNIKKFGRYEKDDFKRRYPRAVHWISLDEFIKNDMIIHRINKTKLLEILK